jgi:cytochrome bd-type quinol oxidase subunit 2
MSNTFAAICLLFAVLCGAIAGGLVILLSLRMVNTRHNSPPSTATVQRWGTLGLTWLIAFAMYAGLVIWRADAPEAKDDVFNRLVCMIWWCSALIITFAEARHFRTKTRNWGRTVGWSIVSVAGQMIALIAMSVIAGIYIYFAAGGRI